MQKIDQLIIVDNNSNRAIETQKAILKAEICENIKIAVNGEHALLCLDHLDLHQRMKGKKIMVLLNMETPIMNGLEFLDGMLHKSYPNKEKILIVVLKDLSSPETIERARKKGITEFVTSPIDIPSLNETLVNYFSEKKKTQFARRQEDEVANRPMSL
jgi:response regulator RpfG family c-di-GMP phosphodiesterase